jgi:hypothetical protein
MAKSNEVKVAEKLADGLNDVTFSPAVLANYIITHYPVYTTERLMELVKYIIHYGSIEMKKEWEINGRTSDGLLLADALHDILETLNNK